MLNKEESCTFIKSAIQEFWANNEGSIDENGIIWDAFKACLRGCLIQHSSHGKKREDTERMLKLEQDINKIEKHYV